MGVAYDWYDSPIGRIYTIVDETGVRYIFLREEEWSLYSSKHEGILRDERLCSAVTGQLEEYFSGKREDFELPLSVEGTDFCKTVWKALQQIPYGETRSYMEIAEAIGKKGACRAIGQANRKNPLPIVIPCHRVIGANGELTGYMGSHTDIKKYLLDLEKSRSTPTL